ncbi:endonuclease/exonuclease/phosphatase family protein [Dactylosporangium sp. AC04546]|uniref:endonuclease/exonuclease/phosphatase family protein n=1 Tax=Dactylosporangium sp. AC04546 TaxID=2862460 RepID=UPI001EDF2A31|nr:endonuclease/exonuclease/phosphatase family protein [Dactylosporangium sp. AC04546]WVK82173.1 endonuclease/exonuclease/phosphatase family protein [Dactylosporangium sp. AC04546]
MTPPSRSSFARTDTLALAAGILLLVDLLRVWLPSIITIFGQAASTPAELMGAFAFAWFAAPFALVRFARRLAFVAAAGLAAARFALVFVHGGQPQLYVASAGLFCGLVWLAATAARGGPAIPGVPLGLAAAALQHAALDTVDLSWRAWWWAAPVVLIEASILLWYSWRPAPDPSRGGGWLLVGPAMLLTGMFVLSPPVVAMGLGGLHDRVVGQPPPVVPQLVFGAAVLAFLIPSLGPPRPRSAFDRWIRVGLLLLGVLLAAAPEPATTSWVAGAVVPVLVAALLGSALAAARRPEARPSGYRALTGMLIFAVGAIGYYAAFDIGYPNAWVPLAVALVPAWSQVRAPAQLPAPSASSASSAEAPPLGTYLIAGIACLLVPLAGVTPRPAVSPVDEARGLRLVAYNIRMGFGLDGTFRPDAAAEAIAEQHPDVVVLSEVDRAWLLNGGHDDLQALSRRLGLRYFFAPAADQYWGDALLTNLPVVRSESVRLSRVGAPTGAQALGVVVEFGNREIAVVSTHIQPPPDAEPLVQVGEIAAFATRFAAGSPAVIAGDLNIEPGGPSLRAFADAGWADGFAADRPVRTFPADVPVKEIDHMLLNGLTASAVAVGTAVTSDHALIAATLT